MFLLVTHLVNINGYFLASVFKNLRGYIRPKCKNLIEVQIKLLIYQL